MNAKTAKLLRRYASVSNKNPKALKKLWKKAPHPIRSEFRGAVRAELS